MDFQLFGILSACVPRFFKDKESGRDVQYFESGIQTRDGFTVITSIDTREYTGKKCVFKVTARPSKQSAKAYTLKVTAVALQEDGETIIN